MKPVVHGSHTLREYVCVDLRGRQIGVPEHHLDGAKIRSALEEMRGERVPEDVRAERSAEACLTRVAFQDLPESNAREPGTSAARVDEEPRTASLTKQRRP